MNKEVLTEEMFDKAIEELSNPTEKKQEKTLSKSEQRKAEKKAQKQAAEIKKIENTMVTRKEAYVIAEKVVTEHIQAVGELIREPLRTNLIATMALAEILKEKGIITEEEHIVSMQRIAEDMNASIENVQEGGEDGQGESDPIQDSYEDGTTDNEETQE